MQKKTFKGIKITPENKCGFCRSSICCTYITQEIDTPRSIYDFDVLLWQIYHQDVQFYKEDNRWYIKILSRCNNLQPDGRCGVYETRPMICREHENDFCEFDETTEESADVFFGSAADIEKYCAKRFRHWKTRYQKFEAKKVG